MNFKTTLLRLSLPCIFALLASFAWAKTDAPDTSSPLDELRKAAEDGDRAASFTLGMKYFSGEDGVQNFSEAVKWFETAADQGNEDACINLGFFYDTGIGVAQDYLKAAKWYTAAAEKGNATAQFNLGILYDFGKGVAQDYSEAAKWYTMAANQGCLGAQYNLGNLYLTGRGVEQNLVTAETWYLVAAAYDHAEAKKQHDLLIQKLTPEEYEKAYESACKIGASMFAAVVNHSVASGS